MEKVIGVDLYNQQATGEKSKTLNAVKSDADHVPCVLEPTGFDSWNLALTGEVGRTLSTPSGGLNEHIPVVMEMKAVSASKASYFMHTTEDYASALVATDYKDPPVVVEEMSETYSIENHPNDSRMKIDPSGKVQTLSSRMGTGGNNTPMVMGAFRKQGHPHNAEMAQGYEEADVSDTLNIYDQGEIRTPNLITEGEEMANEYAVRRLTPLECERLQGFPDGWTDIGEWTDSKGKVRQTTDSARYKALGNSICLPPWKWVLKRISATYERDATLGSLFDGIAGFPYLWEQLNGKGSCLWASEIEEFCIAVTEKRINGKDTVDLRRTD